MAHVITAIKRSGYVITAIKAWPLTDMKNNVLLIVFWFKVTQV